jgi:hypothetical protein
MNALNSLSDKIFFWFGIIVVLIILWIVIKDWREDENDQ